MRLRTKSALEIITLCYNIFSADLQYIARTLDSPAFKGGYRGSFYMDIAKSNFSTRKNNFSVLSGEAFQSLPALCRVFNKHLNSFTYKPVVISLRLFCKKF